MKLLRAERPAHVITLGAEMAVFASADQTYRNIVNSADLVVPDTVGVVVASKLLGRPVPSRIAGIELADQMIKRCARKGFGVYFLGGAEGVAAAAAGELAKQFEGLRVSGTHHGYFIPDEEPELAARIRESGARLVLVGMGFPQQEYWIRRNLERLGPAVCIGVGGSFDVWSGRLKRAPEGVRRAGMEWLYRLVNEPRRLGRQLALPRFAAQVTVQAVRERIGARKARARKSPANGPAGAPETGPAPKPNGA